MSGGLSTEHGKNRPPADGDKEDFGSLQDLSQRPSDYDDSVRRGPPRLGAGTEQDWMGFGAPALLFTTACLVRHILIEICTESSTSMR